MPSSRRSSRPRDRTQVSRIAGRFFLPFEPPGSQLCINMQTNEVRPPASQHRWQMIIALITFYHVWQAALQFWSSKSSISVPGLKANCPQGWSQEEDSLFAFFLILAAICIPGLLAASPTFIANSTASFDLLPSLLILLLAQHLFLFCSWVSFWALQMSLINCLVRTPVIAFRVHLGNPG